LIELTIEQVKIAQQKALNNAEALVKDAEALFELKSYPRVVFLSQIAGEEIGKHIMFSSLFVRLLAGEEINWKKFWTKATSHKRKLELVTYMEDVYLEQPFPESLKEYFEKIALQIRDLDRFKQKALYSDFTEGYPHTPNDIIDETIAKNALAWAKGRIGVFSTIEAELQKSGIFEKMTKESVQEISKKLGIEKFFQTNET